MFLQEILKQVPGTEVTGNPLVRILGISYDSRNVRTGHLFVAMKGEKAFFLLVKTAFNQRRKTLRNALKALFDPAVLADPIFNRRAEQLSVNDFAALTWKMR